MAFNKNRLHELDIACTIKKTSTHALGKEWDCTSQWLRMVARGEGTSARLEKMIVEFIEDAKQIIHFEYPYEKAA